MEKAASHSRRFATSCSLYWRVNSVSRKFHFRLLGLNGFIAMNEFGFNPPLRINYYDLKYTCTLTRIVSLPKGG